MDDLAATLARQQGALQREADAVVADLDLAVLLSTVGRLVRVGSSALGLMVRRDLDVTVICSKLDRRPVLEVATQLAGHRRVRQLVFRNDTGSWNTDPNYPDGLYLGVSCRSAAGAEWTVDIWFVDQPERQPDLAHLRSIPPRLNDETRSAILAIKTAWAQNPEYGRGVSSADVYMAVLEAGVRTPEQFDAWLAHRSAD